MAKLQIQNANNKNKKLFSSHTSRKRISSPNIKNPTEIKIRKKKNQRPSSKMGKGYALIVHRQKEIQMFL